MFQDWVEEFFTTTGKWWAEEEKQITRDDYRRLAAIKRLAGKPPRRILELGSSYGNTAAVCAEAGYEVVGLEISERIKTAREYEIMQERLLTFIKQDFNKFKTDKLFDVVCYWNGFGIGTDEDLRRLLVKMASEWLATNGCALMDIQNPFWWERWAGKKSLGDKMELVVFDPIKNQFTDTWWDKNEPQAKITQQMRCFAPADFKLLVEGTGLKIDKMEISEKSEHEYLVKLVKI